jgi:hypothetical protein
MPIEQSRDPKQFADFELAGWDANISGYDSAFGAVARQTVRPMLDAARVKRGMRVLDVCRPYCNFSPRYLLAKKRLTVAGPGKRSLMAPMSLGTRASARIIRTHAKRQ